MNIKKMLKKILGNKTKKEWMYAVLNHLLPLRSVNTNKYLFISMKGANYGCNPKYLAQYIKDHEPNSIIVWAFNERCYEKNKDVVEHAVMIGSWRYYYELCTSKYFISNERTSKKILPDKRIGQIYMHTWHGAIGPKKAEADVDWPNDAYKNMAVKDSSLIDTIISGTHFQTKLFTTSFWYNGPIVETGTPRNDIFFSNNKQIVEKVRTTLGIGTNEKIILYAPTFRTHKDSFSCYDVDANTVVNALKNKYGGEFRLVVRLHPDILSQENVKKLNILYPDAVNASWYGDMQELLYASDVLITDYSSSIFDYIYTKRPCFLYVPDAEEYDRGFTISLNALPFPQIRSNKSWANAIANFDDDSYRTKVDDFIKDIMGSVEDGHASERCYKLLKSL